MYSGEPAGGDTSKTAREFFVVIDPIERIESSVLGERLRIARARSGLTQDQAARAVDMARTTLVAIEKGERRIRPNELRSIAQLYSLSLNELLRDHAVQIDLEPRFRAMPETLRSASASALLNDLAAAEVELERLLGRRPPRVYPPERPIGPGDPEQQAEDAAMELRHRLGRGLSPIKDLIAILEVELAIRVFIRPIEERSISGLFVFDETIGACILLNANHSADRRLQSAAHETGHFVGTRGKPDVDSSAVDTNSREERFAKRFGFAFLMPAAAVRAMFADFVREHGRFSPRHLVLMAAHFGVAQEACCRRLEELGLLPARTWESMKARGFTGDVARKLLDEAGFATASSGNDQVTPRLWLLAAEAYDRGLVTEGQLSRMLRLPRVEIRRILDTLDGEEMGDLQDAEIATG
jgi:Zn-dependent peptidase ImmA (M78 family)/DNA-binding XRE family transcriptional regulator